MCICHLITCVDSYNHNHKQHTESFYHHKDLLCVLPLQPHQFLPCTTPHSWQVLFCFHLCNLSISNILYKWNHIVCDLLILAFFLLTDIIIFQISKLPLVSIVHYFIVEQYSFLELCHNCEQLHIDFCVDIFISVGKCPGLQLMDICKVYIGFGFVVLLFKYTNKPLSRLDILFAFLPVNEHEWASLSDSSPAFVIVFFLIYLF